jgi:hypothetical protein
MAAKPPAHYNLAELREWLRPRLEKPGGLRCPCCGQHAQAYKRRVTESMVATMGRMLLVQKVAQERLASVGAIDRGNRVGYRDDEDTGQRWIHLPAIRQHSRDAAMLAYWDLIEEWSVVREDGGRAGYWRVTERGEQFLAGELMIERYAHVYGGKVYRHSGPMIDVKEVAPKFNLRELMKGV